MNKIDDNNLTFPSLVRPHSRKIAKTILYMFVANILSLVLPWSIKIIIDDVLVRRDVQLLGYLGIGLICVFLLRAGFNYLRKINGSMLGENIICLLREAIFWHIRKINLNTVKTISPSLVLTRMSSDCECIRKFLINDMVEWVYSIMSACFIFLILAAINLRLTAICLCALPAFLLCYLVVLPRLKKGYRNLREANGQLIARISEVLNALSLVRVFNAEEYEKNRFVHQQDKMLRITRKNHTYNSLISNGIELFASISLVCVLWFGGQEVINEKMTSGEIVAFYTYLAMLFSPLIRMVTISGTYQESQSALSRINEIMCINDDVFRKPSPNSLTEINSIEFKDVTFGYLQNNEIISNISFKAQKGDVIGIVGPSGAGKTTIINLLVRYMDPLSGTIFVNDHDLKDLDLDQYRKNIATVLQDDYLFNGTILDNICYPDRSYDFDDITKSAEVAQAHSFISQFAQGYMTNISERGMRLSNGQRQRIAIARALIRNPSVLILDEATSSIDALTENKIQKSICEGHKDKIVFIVAHRFSTIMEADKIVVVDNGIIVEVGNHNKLLKKGGFYSNLYYEQFKHSNEDVLA